MTTVSPAIDFVAAEVIEEEGRPPSAWRAILGSGEGRIGIGIGSMVLFVIAFGRFFTPYPPDAHAVHAVGTGSLLVRTEEGMFGFIHASVMEWLVARHIAATMGDPQILGVAHNGLAHVHRRQSLRVLCHLFHPP